MEVHGLINVSMRRNHLFHSVTVDVKDWVNQDWEITINHVLASNENFTLWENPPKELPSLLRENYMGTYFLRA